MCGNLIKLNSNIVVETQCIICDKKVFVPCTDKRVVVVCDECKKAVKKIKEGA